MTGFDLSKVTDCEKVALDDLWNEAENYGHLTIWSSRVDPVKRSYHASIRLSGGRSVETNYGLRLKTAIFHAILMAQKEMAKRSG